MNRRRKRVSGGGRKTATIERFRAVKIGEMVTKERVRLPCGCCMYVGVYAEAQERATTGAQPCCVQHEVITLRANDLLLQELAQPGHRLVIDLAQKVLSQAARELL